MRRHLVLAIALLAGACSAFPERAESPTQAAERRAQAPRPAYNLAGYPPAARAGYVDGCESAKRSEYGHKDESRMANDPQYAMGWNDGYSICSRR
ncbi:MAG TPA: hypothetical protein VN782_08650 [Usitatibacter sp.]|nr:hypothetical protein [Usitatibacter sp.]